MKNIIFYFLLIISLLLIWHFATFDNTHLKLLISNPFDSFKYFLNECDNILIATAYTGLESVLGFLIAVITSFVLVIICLYNYKLFELILPLMIVSQVIPIITLAPLFIILLDIGLKSKVAMAALMCFFPIFVNMASGVNSVEKNYLNLFSIYNSSKTKKIFHLLFPLATPYIFSGLKISSTLAVIGAIVAEFNGAELGLGKNLFLSAKRLEAELMINSIFFSCILGASFYLMIYSFERRIGKWYIKDQKHN